MKDTDYEILTLSTALKWRQWLDKNHAVSQGEWLQFFKKSSGVKTITYQEALDEALCYGWIDGQLKKHDEESWLHKFTPRRPKSVWSKKNKEHVARLIKEGRMQKAGLKQVEEAKKDGRWEKAYDSPGNATIPEDFLKRLSLNKKAKAFFTTLNKANRYSIVWRLQTAKKPETREKRIATIIEMLGKGEKFH